uniref:DUF4476 domain-containing protein n=1 Tax=Angiostrongylus cantonensis TaxID=6313 RepID=A0A0K0DJG4_ANGCA
MSSVKNVAEIKQDIEKSVKREGTFDVVRKQAFAIVNSDGFLESLQVEKALMMKSVMEGKLSVDVFDFGNLVDSVDYSSSDNSCSRLKSSSDMSVSDVASNSSFIDVIT